MEPKYRIAMMLSEYGLRPSEIAASIYDVDWKRLDLSTRRRLVNRVLGLLRYAESRGRVYDGNPPVFMTDGFYDADREDRIDDSGGVRDLSGWTPSRDGTADVYERKRLAVSDEEKYFTEYERILFFFYERSIAEYDTMSRDLWNRIIVVHRKIFGEYWRRFKRKISFDGTRVPEVIAAYIYVVFFGALYSWPGFYSIRGRLNRLLSSFVRRPEKYQEYIRVLLPLIADLI